MRTFSCPNPHPSNSPPVFLGASWTLFVLWVYEYVEAAETVGPYEGVAAMLLDNPLHHPLELATRIFEPHYEHLPFHYPPGVVLHVKC